MGTRTSDRELALERLRLWHAERPWARLAPSTIDVGEIRAIGPCEIELATRYEARGIAYDLVPAQQRSLERPQPPDPWAYPLEIGAQPPVGAEARFTPDVPLVGLDCTGCSGAGELKCEHCDGTGRIRAGRHSYPCPRCGGRSVLPCGACRGSGGVIGRPSVWARIGEARARRTTDDPSLPTEVAVDLADRPTSGETVWRIEAETITEAMLDPSLDAAVLACARELLAAPDLPAAVRVHRQTLEVRRARVLEIRRISGATFWVWGDPPAVHPAGALASTMGRMLPFLGR